MNDVELKKCSDCFYEGKVGSLLMTVIQVKDGWAIMVWTTHKGCYREEHAFRKTLKGALSAAPKTAFKLLNKLCSESLRLRKIVDKTELGMGLKGDY